MINLVSIISFIKNDFYYLVKCNLLKGLSFYEFHQLNPLQETNQYPYFTNLLLKTLIFLIVYQFNKDHLLYQAL